MRLGTLAERYFKDDPGTPLIKLRQFGVWFHRTFAEPRFAPGPFVPPSDPVEAAHSTALLDRLDQATLAKAFRGELLASGHAEEPEGEQEQNDGTSA